MDNYQKCNFWHFKKYSRSCPSASKTDKWDYLRSPNSISCFDIEEVPKSPGKWKWNLLSFLPFIFTFKTMGEIQCKLINSLLYAGRLGSMNFKFNFKFVYWSFELQLLIIIMSSTKMYSFYFSGKFALLNEEYFDTFFNHT